MRDKTAEALGVLRSRLQASSRPGTGVVIHADPGTGAREEVARWLGSRPVAEKALVVVPSVVLREVWSLRARDVGAIVRTLDNQQLLQLLEEGGGQDLPGGIYTATTAAVAAGMLGKAMSSLAFDNLVLDSPPNTQVAGAGSDRSRTFDNLLRGSFGQVVILAATPWDGASWLTPRFDTIRIRKSSPTSVRVVSTETDPEEAAAMSTLEALIQTFAPDRLTTRQIRTMSRHQLHATVLHALTSGEASLERGSAADHDAAVDEAWSSLDAIEAMGPGPRFSALLQVIDETQTKRALTVIDVGRRLSELSYVITTLSDHGYACQAMTAHTSAFATYTDWGTIVIGTTRAIAQALAWPKDARLIVWQSDDRADDLRAVATAAFHNVIILR